MATPQAASKSGSLMGRVPRGAAARDRGEVQEEHPHSAGLAPQEKLGLPLGGNHCLVPNWKCLLDKDFGGSFHILPLCSGTI